MVYAFTNNTDLMQDGTVGFEWIGFEKEDFRKGAHKTWYL